MDKGKVIKWVKEEICGCETRGEIERGQAMTEFLLKVERGYFDKENNQSNVADAQRVNMH